MCLIVNNCWNHLNEFLHKFHLKQNWNWTNLLGCLLEIWFHFHYKPVYEWWKYVCYQHLVWEVMQNCKSDRLWGKKTKMSQLSLLKWEDAMIFFLDILTYILMKWPLEWKNSIKLRSLTIWQINIILKGALTKKNV